MGVMRKAWHHPAPWALARRASVAAGMATAVYQLAVWTAQQADPVWALFRIAVGVGLVGVAAFAGWGALSSVLAGIEISRAYDPPSGQAGWSGGLRAQHTNHGVLVVDE